MKLSFFITIALCPLLSGCATASFSPPVIEVAQDGDKNLSAALAVVEKLIFEYRRRAGSAANGRQFFEVPSFVGAIGTVTATALGAGRNVTIGSGAATALLAGGKSYYAPKEKSAIYNSAYSAMLCIEQVAVGVKPYSDAQPGTVEKSIAIAANGEAEQYYFLVRNAAFEVERILITRLASAGRLSDVEDIVASYQRAIDSKNQKESDAKSIASSIKSAGQNLSQKEKNAFTLQPDLQMCVLRAKI